MKQKFVPVNLVILILVALAHSAPTTSPTPAPSSGPETRLTKISENVYTFVIRQSGFQQNSMFIITKRGVIVIEPFSSNYSKQLLAAIRTVTQKPIKFLLISHNHYDHANGGKVFSDEGATVMAHQEAVDWMKANPHPDLYIPDRTWIGTKCTIRLGGARVDLHYFGMNHGNGMTVFVYKPPRSQPKGENIAFMADLVTPNQVFFSNAPDYNMKETMRTFREILKLDFERAVFSHSERGDLSADGTKKDVSDLLQYATDVKAGVEKSFAEGKFLISNPELLQLPQYRNLGRYETDFSRNVLKFAFEFFIGPYPWRSVEKYTAPRQARPRPGYGKRYRSRSHPWKNAL